MYTGPNIVRDGLIFGYDSNEDSRFYKGEPTTNLNTDPLHNTHINKETITASVWGGDSGYGEFLNDTNPDSLSGSLMYINHNTTISGGTGGVYNDFATTLFTLTSGSTYTRSWYMKCNIDKSVSGHICSCNKASNNTYIVNGSYNVTTEWQRFSHTFTYVGPTSSDWRFRHINYETSNISISSVQLEEKPHPTKFTEGTRSDTEGLLDMEKTTTINLGNVSFNSNSLPYFNGASNYIDLSIGNHGLNVSNFSCECVFEFYTVGNKNTLLSLNYNNPSSGYLIRQHTTNSLIIYSDHAGETSATSTKVVPIDTKFHLVVTQNNNTVNIYLNGDLDKSTTLLNPVLNINEPTYIGRRGVPIGAYLDGSVYISKIYNKALSQEEVTQNFNSYKNRFNIS